jgi:hypothetical protein
VSLPEIPFCFIVDGLEKKSYDDNIQTDLKMAIKMFVLMK